MQHRADRRVSPDGYPQQVAHNAVKRHRESCGPPHDNLFIDLLQMCNAATHCAQFGCPLNFAARSPYSVSINRRDPSNSEYPPYDNAEVTCLAGNLLLGNTPVATIPNLKIFMSRHILDGYDPTSDSWLAELNSLPKPQLKFDADAEALIHQKIRHILNELRFRDKDPKRCARKNWVIGAFILVTFAQALAMLIAQNFRCAVTGNELSFTGNQLNSMRCAANFLC